MLNDAQIQELVAAGNAQRARLLPLFEKVQDPHDWKAPIRATVPTHQLQDYRDAIVFFTATEPRTEDVCMEGYTVIVSEGYRRGPAGDH